MSTPADPRPRRIILARHGEATWTGIRYAGNTDIPLTDVGRASAARLAGVILASGHLADPRAVIVSSPLQRAFETACTVGAATGRRIIVDERWREVSFGALEGLTFDEATAAWPNLVARMRAGDIEIDWPDGETWAGLLGRVADAWAEVVARAVPVLVVSHGVTIRAALAHATGAGPGGSRPFPLVTPAGTIAVCHEGDAWVVEPDWPSAAGGAVSAPEPA